eukprot:COSAG04_NODE_8167_length_1012_cov_1.539978_2_plen_46_part_00
MFIQTQGTPNPNAMMFLPGKDVMGEVRHHCQLSLPTRGEPGASCG